MEITRRDALIGGAAFAFAGPGALAAEPRKVGFAILGLGGYAQGQILPRIERCENARLAALVSGTPSKLASLGEKYGVPETARYGYDRMDAIADDPNIEVVYVITPPGTHREFTERALKAGKHVLCEKPMAGTSADARAMIAAADAAGKRLMIGYRSHFEPNNLRAMELCRGGELGAIRSIASEHGFQGPLGVWRTTSRKLAGGGALWDIGIYGVQAALYLSGENPAEIVAFGDRLKGDARFREVDDVTHLLLKFPSGAIASVSTGYSWSGANTYRVIGTRASLVAENATSYGGHRFTLRGKPLEVAPADQFVAMMEHMAAAVLDPSLVLRTPGEMGLRDLIILEAARDSADRGGTAIRPKFVV